MHIDIIGINILLQASIMSGLWTAVSSLEIGAPWSKLRGYSSPNSNNSTQLQSTFVSVCGVGSYILDGACLLCPVGTFSNTSNSIACKQCLTGTLSVAGSSSCLYTASTCPVGTFADVDSNACLSCSAGTYSSANGSTICLNCTPGTYSDSVGASACSICSGGYYSPTGSSTCFPCFSGEYSVGGSANCSISCPVGYYKVPQYGSCLKCPWFQTSNSVDSHCVMTPIGWMIPTMVLVMVAYFGTSADLTQIVPGEIIDKKLEEKYDRNRGPSYRSVDQEGSEDDSFLLQPERDVFFSYRREKDRGIVQKIYTKLGKHGISAYWDEKELVCGLPWEQRFPDSLLRSRVFVPILSENGLKPYFEKLREASPVDNVLLEYRLALEYSQRGVVKCIHPVSVGSLTNDDYFNDYYKSYQGKTAEPQCPKVLVASVERKVHEHLHRQGLGDPLVRKNSVKETYTGITHFQGTLLKCMNEPEEYDKALDKIVKQIFEAVGRVRSSENNDSVSGVMRSSSRTSPSACDNCLSIINLILIIVLGLVLYNYYILT